MSAVFEKIIHVADFVADRRRVKRAGPVTVNYAAIWLRVVKRLLTAG